MVRERGACSAGRCGCGFTEGEARQKGCVLGRTSAREKKEREGWVGGWEWVEKGKVQRKVQSFYRCPAPSRTWPCRLRPCSSDDRVARRRRSASSRAAKSTSVHCGLLHSLPKKARPPSMAPPRWSLSARLARASRAQVVVIFTWGYHLVRITLSATTRPRSRSWDLMRLRAEDKAEKPGFARRRVECELSTYLCQVS